MIVGSEDITDRVQKDLQLLAATIRSSSSSLVRGRERKACRTRLVVQERKERCESRAG